MPTGTNPKIEKIEELLIQLLNSFWDLSEEERKILLENKPALREYLENIGAIPF